MISVTEAKAAIMAVAQKNNLTVEEAIQAAYEAMEAASRHLIAVSLMLGASVEEAEKKIQDLPSRKNVEEAIRQLKVETN